MQIGGVVAGVLFGADWCCIRVCVSLNWSRVRGLVEVDVDGAAVLADVGHAACQAVDVDLAAVT